MPKRKVTAKEFYDWVVDMEAMALVEGRRAKKYPEEGIGLGT